MLERHVVRSHTLERVLDPEDTEAIALSPDLDSYAEELNRRRNEIKRIVKWIRELLKGGD